jgi:hypothetical protein
MEDVLAVRDEYRADQWSMVVQECAASGLSNREFCRLRGISEKSFYYWQRKLRKQVAESTCKQSGKISQNSPESIPLSAGPEGTIRHKVYQSCEDTKPKSS